MRLARTAPILLTLLLSAAAEASEAERLAELSEAVSDMFDRAERARTLVRHCNVAEPAQAGALRDALASWSYRNDAAFYDAAIAAIAAAAPGLSEQLDDGRTRLDQTVAEQLAGSPDICGGLSDRLATDEFSLKNPLRRTRRIAAGFGLEIHEPEPPAPADPTEILPLAQFSATASVWMDEVGSKGGAAKDRDLRQAREAHLLSRVQETRPLMLHGRAVSDDELREWRGEQQSSFAASCSSFADDDAEARMAALRGSNTVLAGVPARVAETDNGGVVVLHDCQPLTLSEAALPLSPSGPAELVMRPPEIDEVRAAPGQGIAPDRIHRVLYDAAFQTRMDGFGNGYVDRREHVYVLLRGGSAWRHDWPFPPADLDFGVSQRREPEKWFIWSGTGDTMILTRKDGDPAERIDLSSARRLAPMPKDARLDATYRFTSIGMMGLRQDQHLTFSADGTVLYRRDAFAGGNVGTSFVTATLGPGAQNRSRYRFDGFGLILEGSEGEERHFFARMDGSDARVPEDVILDGRIFWGMGD